MTMPVRAPTIDPLGSLVAGAFVTGTRHPVPLVGTRFDVAIEGGLATVSTRRTFRNDEAGSIEVTLTFPMPVAATLYRLEARIGDRTLTAVAQARGEARSTYESAVDRGLLAVLHEELLRGIHMLSIAHVPPGAEIVVTADWASTLTILDAAGHLRIPLTVGDVYGRSGLPDSDDLIGGGPPQLATVAVRSDAALVRLRGGALVDGRATVRMNAPIDIEVAGWTSRELSGRAADGRQVRLRVEPVEPGTGALHAALLVDHSGSMAGLCGGPGAEITKHEALVAGLRQVARTLCAHDAVELWEFDDKAAPIPAPSGSVGSIEACFREQIGRLSAPAGGTELGLALDSVMRGSKAPDILLVTDGKSHALDVHRLAREGRRVVVVLVGEDSLEARVGYLAALTGGDILVSDGSDIAAALAAAMSALRRPTVPPTRIVGKPARLSVVRGNARIAAEWREGPAGVTGTPGRAVAALAAGLALPAMNEENAARLAAAEGLVTHLTSLVLVDEDGPVQEGLPATRKLRLEEPVMACPVFNDLGATETVRCYSLGGGSIARGLRNLMAFKRRRVRKSPSKWLRPRPTALPPSTAERFASLADRVPWDLVAKELASGDVSVLEPGLRGRIFALAVLHEVAAVAGRLKIAPFTLVIGLLALAAAAGGKRRSAERVARMILGRSPSAAAMDLVGRLDRAL